ncbi:hypothetical protein HAX54_030508, partial [Datura stramonium]|nr:hypothetical protein [Datura stramonium]
EFIVSCFTQQVTLSLETIDFDLHAGHFTYHDEHAKGEHFKPLFDHIGTSRKLYTTFSLSSIGSRPRRTGKQ